MGDGQVLLELAGGQVQGERRGDWLLTPTGRLTGHMALLGGGGRSEICRLNRDSTPLGDSGGGPWKGLSLGMVAGLSPMCPQIPETTFVSSAPGLSAPAATWSSTGASTLERNPCSECGEESPGWGEMGRCWQDIWAVGTRRNPWGSQDGLRPVSSPCCPWLRCEICGFTCRQKASLNWHRRKHAETVAALRFPCEFCGKRFEKPDSVTAHRSKSHPALLLAPQELAGPLESCSSISAPACLGTDEGSRPSLAPQAPTLLP